MSNAAVINATHNSGQLAGSPIAIEASGTIVFKAFGSGSGAWSVTLAFAPSATESPVTLTISNGPGKDSARTSVVSTGATSWVGWVQSFTGEFEVSGLVCGDQPDEALAGDLGVFVPGTAPTKAIKAGATYRDTSGTQYTYSAGAGWVRVQFALKKRIISSLGGWRSHGNTRTSNGTTQTSTTDRMLFRVFAPSSRIQLLYVDGVWNNSGLMSPVGNKISLKASIDVVPVNIPVTIAFNPLSDYGIAISDELPIILHPSANQFVRTYVAVSAGEKWPTPYLFPAGGSTTTDIANGTTVKTGADTTDPNSYGSAMGVPVSNSQGIGPCAIIGVMFNPVPVLMVAGDSIANGDGATLGYIQSAFSGMTDIGLHTDTLSGGAINALNKYDTISARLSEYVDGIIFHMGTNDIAAGLIASIDNYKTEILNWMRRNYYSNNFWITTILPRTGSSDSWSTYANQTKQSYESLRVDINNFIRTGLQDFAAQNGFKATGVDVCLGFERNLDGSNIALSSGIQAQGTGGYYPVNGAANFYTFDGIHPSDNSVSILKVLVPASRIILESK